MGLQEHLHGKRKVMIPLIKHVLNFNSQFPTIDDSEENEECVVHYNGDDAYYRSCIDVYIAQPFDCNLKPFDDNLKSFDDNDLKYYSMYYDLQKNFNV